MFLRAVDDKDNIFKVPFDKKHVQGSLTEEVLCEEIINQNNVKNNAEIKMDEINNEFEDN